METSSDPCHIMSMTKQPKRPRDPSQLAKLMVDIAAGDAQDEDCRAEGTTLSDLGRVGGLKGGNARARSLSPDRRAEIARKGAAARWAKKD